MPDAPARTILAFDFGQRRIGVACGDTITRTAAPLDVVERTRADAWERLSKLLREWQPSLAVVGLPYNADGSDSTTTRAARAFAAELSQRFGVSIELVDERYSSLEAESRLQAARALGVRRRRVAKGDVDAAAAGIILERWFSDKT